MDPIDSKLVDLAITRYSEVDTYHPGRHAERIKRLAEVLAKHPDAWVEVCKDEFTGVRYGQAVCRRGRCLKIGYTTLVEQFWAVW